ncbi:MAG: pyridoxal-dependent decarboxylase, exosortase system-associated [Sphingomonas bacterium]|uniref:pyridoxal-dependent decarboxylase, exosortase A system-associated n=1 Tax=Sphingomonas bacterium TaxID=1895847 RepID=UPI00262E5A6B|nr:pyridoxal-dependent decarboxylase, exosortase A system-associated [Sphingomonas bacterium]MDB5708232.1 pyridoxal-dependent decarboxylase, exosortase system-associated [Sphingomonas bacterium]
MKPMGAIPPDFAGSAPLQIAGRAASAWIEQAGDTPLFVYDAGVVRRRIARFRQAVPEGVDLHYAVKANPFAPLVAAIAPWVDGLDIASKGELELVMAIAGKPASAISFAGPGKRDDELDLAIRAGVTVNLESEGEADRALAIGGRLGVTPRLAVRVNPDIELRGSGLRMGGRPSQFGVDAERAAALVTRLVVAGADWRGFHIFAGSQALDAQAIIETQAATLALAARLADEAGAAPPLVNLGGGFGIPYFPADAALDVEAIGAALAGALAERPAILGETRFAIELGRWLVGECGVYLTRVVDRKVSRGETFLVVDGGLHHQLAASGNFGTVVRRNYPVAVASAAPDVPTETVTVVGCLCTPLDLLADKVTLPVAHPGDVIAIFMAGAYAASASPSAFLGHSPARELLVGLDGQS